VLHPDWAQTLSLANPMFYLVDAFRYGFLGVSDAPVGVTLSMLAAVGILLSLTAMKLMTGRSGIRE